MNNLKRELAPISSSAWHEIDAEATRVLKLKLAGRKLVDFEGPLGPTGAAVNTGRRERLNAGPVADVEASRRQVLPLVELRAYFDLSREEMDGVERGAKDPELQPLIDAATRIAYAEDTAIFHGYAAGGIKGIDQVTAYPILPIPDDYQDYPRSIAEATRLLRLAGVDGPYAIALGPRSYTGLTQAVGDGGYPVLNVVRKLVDGPIVWAPAISGAVVMSQRGGDFEL
ncbi:MAG TPA: family 1 encapsulin nanocompartment shell protein, partial [Methylomirabilota bacterium]|nr:family 1 encapsulin nanocompartment shell protein [Methylomirabilota bacterium]